MSPRQTLLALALLLAIYGVARLHRYEIAAPAGAGVYVLDRWTGEVALCTELTCRRVYPPVIWTPMPDPMPRR